MDTRNLPSASGKLCGNMWLSAVLVVVFVRELRADCGQGTVLSVICRSLDTILLLLKVERFVVTLPDSVTVSTERRPPPPSSRRMKDSLPCLCSRPQDLMISPVSPFLPSSHLRARPREKKKTGQVPAQSACRDNSWRLTSYVSTLCGVVDVISPSWPTRSAGNDELDIYRVVCKSRSWC